MTAFIDTYALIAWLNSKYHAHQKVTAFLDSFTGKLITTELILLEFADALADRKSRSIVLSFLKSIRTDPQFEIVDWDSRMFEAGFDLYSARHDKDWSLTDCISFAVMEKKGLVDALTGDQHFEQAGFRAVFK